MENNKIRTGNSTKLSMSKERRAVTCLLKILVIVSAVVGIGLSAASGDEYFMGGRHVFMYFTIQSNLLIAIICLVGVILVFRGCEVGNAWFVFKYVGTVAITLTGMVFCFVLVPVFGPSAWNLQNVLTHVVVPVAAVIDFFVTGVFGRIKSKDVIFVTIPPLMYAVYAGIGYAARWEFARGIYYPYFFLNWGSPAGAFGFTDSLPYMGCVWWILALLLFLIVVGLVYLAILNLLKKHMHK